MSGIDVLQDAVNKNSQITLGNKFKVGDGIFVLSNSEKENLDFSEKELELIKPYYTTKELTKIHGEKENKYWIIYTNSSFKDPKKIVAYPKIKEHLDKFRSVITSENGIYGLNRPREEYFFQGEKIMSVRKCAIPAFTYTDFDCYVSRAFFSIKSNRINHKYLTAILNSTLVAFWLKNKGKMQGFQYQIDKDPLINIPIALTLDTIIFQSLVDYIIFLKSNKQQQLFTHTTNDRITSHIEDILNMMVCELYFDEHMKSVGIDVLQFIHPKSISDLTSVEAKVEVIKDFYLWYQQPENPVRQRLLLVETRSKDIIALINKSIQ